MFAVSCTVVGYFVQLSIIAVEFRDNVAFICR